MTEFSNLELEAYLDESLPNEVAGEIERALHDDPALGERLAALNAKRGAGVHSVGEIWRRHRISCPSRQQLGNLLLGVLPAEEADYIRFHLEDVGCRQCQANVADLNDQQAEAADRIKTRRSKYFESSAGYLSRK
ncbi:MAG: hypothetical protein VX988_02980 [Planctomycetota bacterium]|nr:hypothetical protein [Planctomycetota bacterium]